VYTWKRAALGAAVAALVVAVALSARAQQPAQKTIGPGSCASGPCHDIALQWWQTDAHYTTAQPFLEQSGKYKAVAQRLQISMDDAAAMNTRCMNCHGTVLSGSEKKLVEEGVSCESCHGPAGAWKDPHQDKTSSYAKLEGAGMERVDQPAARAKVCVDCHYIVDQDLLRAGHPFGWGKDDLSKYTSGVERRISDKRHWNRKTVNAADRDPAPYAARIAQKGDVPDVGPVPGLPTAAVAGERIVYVERDCGGGSGGKSSIFFPTEGTDILLPEFLVSLAPDSVATSLTLVQARIESLYRLLGGVR
jgi:hypothetical protein